jgi:hypothetical protein
MKKLLLLLAPIILLSCENTSIYNPTTPPITIDTTVITLPPVTDKPAQINTIWMKPSGENSSMQGICLKIIDKTGNELFSDLGLIAQDGMFHWHPSLVLQPIDYTFLVLSPAGNVVSESTINLGSVYPQDEYILAPNGMVYYFQLDWL